MSRVWQGGALSKELHGVAMSDKPKQFFNVVALDPPNGCWSTKDPTVFHAHALETTGVDLRGTEFRIESRKSEGVHDWTVERLVECLKSPRASFCGDKCSNCKRTANVLNGPCWTCVCGQFVTLYHVGMPAPHDNPDIGPTLAHIIEAKDRVRVDLNQ